MESERTPHAAYRFDRFVLDLARGALLAEGGAEVPLRAKSFALLRLFVLNPGRLLDRDAIMEAVWPDVTVSDESIAQCVRDIRKALGGEAQRMLKTVLRRGYLFAAEVAPIEPAAAADPERRSVAIGKSEGVIVDLARFRRGEPRSAPAAPELAQEPPSPTADHNLPQPNPNFVGRAAELEALQRALASTSRDAITQSRQAISGLGGIGKTQLALAYAYAHLQDYDLVRWLRAEEPSVLAADYARLAPMLGVDPQVPDQAALITVVRAKLERLDRWLLVFDNATAPGTLDPYLPRTGAGHVLVTSRWQDWEGTAAPLELELLPEAEAVALLLGEGADDAEERAAAAELARELGHLPLALAQARAFMRARKAGVAAYREQLAAVRSKVLAWRPPSAAYPIAVAQAWQASLDHAARDCPSAPKLLQLLAFLAPDAIPRDLLGARPEALPEGLRDLFDRDTAIEALGRYSLLRVALDSLTMHRLVQAVTRDRLDEPAAARCAAMAVALVDAALPPPTWDNVHRSAIERLLPQALAATEWAERFGVGLEGLGAILTIVGEQLSAGQDYAEAEPLLRRAVAVREKVLGPAHPDLATSLHKLANACDWKGSPAEAEPLYWRVLAVRERTLDPEHPLIAEALGCIGQFYLETGRFAEAKPLIERALATYERTTGREHPDLALSLFHMARLYRDIGRPAAAEPYYRRAIAAAEQALGTQHPRVARFLKDLAGIYRATGRLAEAEPLLQRALAINERTSGAEHPDLSTSLNDLGLIFHDTGCYADAEPLFQRALAIRERTFGPDHPYTATCLNNLGLNYKETGRYAEAESHFQRALTIQEQALDPEHPLIAISLGNLGQLYADNDRHAEAEPLLRRSLEINQKALRPDHPHLAVSLSKLGHLYVLTGRFADAAPLLQRWLAIREQAFGPEDPRLARSLNNLGRLYQDCGRHAEAEPLHQRALAIRERAFGPEHSSVGHSLGFLGRLYRDMGRHADAELLLLRALAIHERTPEHLDLAISLDNLARLYRIAGRPAEAEPLYQRALAVREKALPPDHPDLVASLEH